MLYVTARRDALSSYFLCSNDSNHLYLGRKVMKGMGMCGKLVRENGVYAGAG